MSDKTMPACLQSFDRFHLHGLLERKLHPRGSYFFGHIEDKQQLLSTAILILGSKYQHCIDVKHLSMRSKNGGHLQFSDPTYFYLQLL